MKAEYSSPKLIAFGHIESITEALGRDSTKDSVIVNGQVLNVGFTDGSRDIDV